MAGRRMGKRSEEERGLRNFYILRLATAAISFYFAYDLFQTVREDSSSSDSRWIIYLVIIAFVLIGAFLIYLFVRDFRKIKEEEKEISERNKEEKEQLRQMEEMKRQRMQNPSGMSLAQKASFLSGKKDGKEAAAQEDRESEVEESVDAREDIKKEVGESADGREDTKDEDEGINR